MKGDTVKMKECIELCWECRADCQETLFAVCLPHGGAHARSAHVKVMADCIQMCQTAADFMTRGSELHRWTCGACAAICEVCADSCDEIGGKDMERCADICRRCAESCREMSGFVYTIPDAEQVSMRGVLE